MPNVNLWGVTGVNCDSFEFILTILKNLFKIVRLIFYGIYRWKLKLTEMKNENIN